MQHFTFTGSYRLGEMLVRVLQGMFPNQYSQLTAREGHNTLVLPVVFSRRLRAFYSDSGDFLSDQLLFSHAAQILGPNPVTDLALPAHTCLHRIREKGTRGRRHPPVHPSSTTVR